LIRLGLFCEGDFAVLPDLDFTADFVGNADLLNPGNQPASLSPTLSRNAACASS
jgi:hypothetical protein